MATIRQLEELVSTLQRERQTHVDAIAEIDTAFGQLGLAADKPRRRGGRPGRPKKAAAQVRAAAKKRRKRRTFKVSGNDLVLGMIERAGGKGATGAEIQKAWKAAGRAGSAYNTLTLLKKAKKIKRHKAAGERGGRYTVA